MPRVGVGPTCPFEHNILSVARIPFRHLGYIYTLPNICNFIYYLVKDGASLLLHGDVPVIFTRAGVIFVHPDIATIRIQVPTLVLACVLEMRDYVHVK